jgi:hypothetical protein
MKHVSIIKHRFQEFFHFINFIFAIINFLFLFNNIPLSPAYDVYISHFIRYASACFAYENFPKGGKLLRKVDVTGL